MPKKVPMRKDTTYWKFHDEKFSIELKKPDGFLMHYIFKATLGMLSIHPPPSEPTRLVKAFPGAKKPRCGDPKYGHHGMWRGDGSRVSTEKNLAAERGYCWMRMS